MKGSPLDLCFNVKKKSLFTEVCELFISTVIQTHTNIFSGATFCTQLVKT